MFLICWHALTQVALFFFFFNHTGRAAPQSLTAHDVKSAWRSRWLGHSSLATYNTLNEPVCMLLLRVFAFGFYEATLPGPVRVGWAGCGSVWRGSILGLAIARQSVSGWPWCNLQATTSYRENALKTTSNSLIGGWWKSPHWQESSFGGSWSRVCSLFVASCLFMRNFMATVCVLPQVLDALLAVQPVYRYFEGWLLG